MLSPLKSDCVCVCACKEAVFQPDTRTQHCVSSAGEFFQHPRFLLVLLFTPPFPATCSFYHSYLNHHSPPPCFTPRHATPRLASPRYTAPLTHSPPPTCTTHFSGLQSSRRRVNFQQGAEEVYTAYNSFGFATIPLGDASLT